MYVFCKFRLRCATLYRKGMKLISRLSLIDTGLTSHDAFLCVCASECVCVRACRSGWCRQNQGGNLEGF